MCQTDGFGFEVALNEKLGASGEGFHLEYEIVRLAKVSQGLTT